VHSVPRYSRVYSRPGPRAGTDANVYIQLQGSEGQETAALKLDKSGNDFERGKVDDFRVAAVDVGELKRLKIWHDGSGAGGPPPPGRCVLPVTGLA
jgi:hypothetical protein